MGTGIVGSVLAIIAAGIIYQMIKDKKSGKT
ncbi:MAG: FeoB-associated Cys-rich membrane protein [Peptostreptococcaceae bacterium]|nr:FeoB-associated Cys-rich membrane protein [Peptostreptococcaceae bacterium]